MTAGSASSQQADLNFYRQSATTVVRNGLALINPVLSPAEKQIQSTLDIEVTRGNDVSAFAKGKRIVISAGMVAMLHWTTQALIYAGELGKEECFVEFMNYLAKSTADNTERVARNRSPGEVWDLFGYAVRNKSGPCAGIRRSQYTAIPRVGEIEAKFMEASIMFVLLHEVGHHVLGHVKGPKLSGGDKRQAELNADMWAIKTAWRARYNLLGAGPWFHFVAAFDAGTLHDEVASTHPLGARRVLEAIQERRKTLGEDKAFQEALSKSGRGSEFEKSLDEAETAARAAIRG